MSEFHNHTGIPLVLRECEVIQEPEMGTALCAHAHTNVMMLTEELNTLHNMLVTLVACGAPPDPEYIPFHIPFR